MNTPAELVALVALMQDAPDWMLPVYGKHDGLAIAAKRNAGQLQEDQIIWGMDLVSYVPTNKPRHLANP